MKTAFRRSFAALLLIPALLLAACGATAAQEAQPAPTEFPAEAEPTPVSTAAARETVPALPEKDSPTLEDPSPAETETPILPCFDEWLDRNPYVSGWLSMEGIGVDDPVVYTPADQNFFLSRDVDGNPSWRGTLFLALPWREGTNHALIYGHNTGEENHFGMLSRYTDPAFCAAHPTFRFDTLHEAAEYEVFVLFYSEIYEESELESAADRQTLDEGLGEWDSLWDLELGAPYPDRDPYRSKKDIGDGCFRYYYYIDLSDAADFAYYVEQARAAALYETGVDVQWGDRLLTLSTCSDHKPNGRLVLVARMITAD